MDAFTLSFGIIFLAELGDKSQLMAMTFATRYRTITCLLYTSDAADERSSVDLGGRRIIKKKKDMNNHKDTYHHNNNTD